MRDIRPVLMIATVVLFFGAAAAWMSLALWVSMRVAYWPGLVLAFVGLAGSGFFFTIYHWLDRVIPRMPRRD